MASLSSLAAGCVILCLALGIGTATASAANTTNSTGPEGVTNESTEFVPDILGNGYESRTVLQPESYDGKVVSTIIRKKAEEGTKRAIVYIHGYNDYFFQKELGDSIVAHNINFYAVDLRRYGRSYRKGQDMFYCKDLKEYYADIDSTMAQARRDGNRSIVIMGHSTGGLIATLYAKDREQDKTIAALVLNSPFFDWNFGGFTEGVVMPCVSGCGALFKRLKVNGAGKEPCNYAKSLLKEYKGEWEYDKALKLPQGHDKRAGWVRAINRGQKRIHRGLGLIKQVLVMSSDKSSEEGKEWHDECLRTDVVLDVADIQKYGRNIGTSVTEMIVPGGMHDLILSEYSSRKIAYWALFSYLSIINF